MSTVFGTAVNALNVNSQSLSVASQNIANVNTPGYSRQRAVISSEVPLAIGNLELGRGATVEEIERVFNKFAELRVRDAMSEKGENEASAENLQQVENLFNEIDRDGIATFMADLFGAFHDLSENADSLAIRDNVLNKATLLVNHFNELASKLNNARELIDGDIQSAVSEINVLTTQIVDLNGKIQNAVDGTDLVYRDQRNQKVKELAEYVKVNAVETTEGVYQIYIAGGIQLVNGTERGVLSTAADVGNDGLSDIQFTGGSLTAVDITSSIDGGALKGYVDVRDTSIDGYKTTLDELAFEVATEINAIHTTGFGLDGTDGRNFFAALGAIADSAENLAISTDVSGSPSNIAASDTVANLPSGNAIALQMANLGESNITFLSGDATFNQFYATFLSTIGSDTETMLGQAQFSADVLDQAEIQREKISGVSLEEEQINLVRFQSAFEASARLIQVAEEMFQTITELV